MDKVFAKRISGIIGRSELRNVDAQRRSGSMSNDQGASISRPIQISGKSPIAGMPERLAAMQSAERVSISERIQRINGCGFMQHLARQFMRSPDTLWTEGQRMSGEDPWPSCARPLATTIPVKNFQISSTNAEVIQRAGNTFRKIEDATSIEYLNTLRKYIPGLTFLKPFDIYCEFDEKNTDYDSQLKVLDKLLNEFNVFYLAEFAYGDQQIGGYNKIEMLNYLKKFFDSGYEQEMKIIKAQKSAKIKADSSIFLKLSLLVEMLHNYSIQYGDFCKSQSGLKFDNHLAKLSEIYGSLSTFMSGMHILLNYANNKSNSDIITTMKKLKSEELICHAESVLIDSKDSCMRILQKKDINGFIDHTDNFISILEAILIILQLKKSEGIGEFSLHMRSKTEADEVEEYSNCSDSPNSHFSAKFCGNLGEIHKPKKHESSLKHLPVPLSSGSTVSMCSNKKIKKIPLYSMKTIDQGFNLMAISYSPKIIESISRIKKEIGSNEGIRNLLQGMSKLNNDLEKGDFDAMMTELTRIKSLNDSRDIEESKESTYIPAAKDLLEIMCKRFSNKKDE
jgi:hypothetical protein